MIKKDDESNQPHSVLLRPVQDVANQAAEQTNQHHQQQRVSTRLLLA